MEENLRIDDILIYRGSVYTDEANRYQIITGIDVNGDISTKFFDNGGLNYINRKSGYFTFCDIILKEDFKESLSNGVPVNWDYDN